ncbi:hypothetical protein OV079_35440 [Nannocystis pusilla]|uniref:Uncharacterized protein n=1 Tax=Nannocystis pusilla TaxID=889268 RepID=A0A9X3J1J5_9BACT|nr:hypothetical protein [Nannocystis pusilla]MCY1010769.1 hypothetical protein [Nannocystis pusilla]
MKTLPLLRRLGFLFSCTACAVLVPTGCDVKVDVEEGGGKDEEPAPDDCQQQYVNCLDQGHTADECAPLLEGCEPAPVPVPDDCEQAFQVCLEAGIDPTICKLELEQCLPTQPPPVDCQFEVSECLKQGQPPEVCEQLCRPTRARRRRPTTASSSSRCASRRGSIRPSARTS